LKVIGNVNRQQSASVFLAETGKFGCSNFRQTRDSAYGRQNTRQHVRLVIQTHIVCACAKCLAYTLNCLLSRKVKISAT